MRPGPALRRAALALAALCLGGCMGQVPVDVVMAGGEVYFVLEKPAKIRAVWVAPGVAGAQDKDLKPAWALRHSLLSDVKSRRYPKVSQFRYGQRFAEFPAPTGPEALRRNVEYVVNIEMGDRFAREVFLLTDDDRAVMPAPAFERQKGRSYALSAGKDGEKSVVPVPAKK